MGEEKKKNLFEKAIDALTNRDEKETTAPQGKAGAKARANIAVDRPAVDKAVPENVASEEPAADKMADRNVPQQRAAQIRTEAQEETLQRAAAAPKKGIVAVRSLRIRADHTTASEVVGGLVRGDEVSILSTWSDGKNTWAKLENGWAAMLYDGETYIQLS
ncbi:MAG TPA: SH3 domain-containing protein [Anaerolineales bacterium]|nr:SH3 domain-containing protein [Anaerolineales bacterium]